MKGYRNFSAAFFVDKLLVFVDILVIFADKIQISKINSVLIQFKSRRLHHMSLVFLGGRFGTI